MAAAVQQLARAPTSEQPRGRGQRSGCSPSGSSGGLQTALEQQDGAGDLSDAMANNGVNGRKGEEVDTDAEDLPGSRLMVGDDEAVDARTSQTPAAVAGTPETASATRARTAAASVRASDRGGARVGVGEVDRGDARGWVSSTLSSHRHYWPHVSENGRRGRARPRPWRHARGSR